MATTALRTGVRGQQHVFSQVGLPQHVGAQAFGATFSQHAGAQATGFGQAFAHGAGAQAAGFGQAFSHTAGAGQQTAGFGATFSQHAGAQAFGAAFTQQPGSQAFGATFSQHAGAAHAFSQQHFTLPQLRQAKRSFIPLNRSHRLQQVSQAGWPQTAAGAQALAAGLQGAGAAQALHSPQPPQFRPARRSPKSIENPWLARATLTRSAPSTILAFIEQTLLNNELG